MDGLTKMRIMLPPPHEEAFGPGWTDVWTRDAIGSDQSVIDEIWIEDVYRTRGLDKSGWQDKDRGPIIDAGANIGAFSLLCLTYHAKQIIAIEPSPANLAILSANLGAKDRVQLRTAALTADGRPVKLSGEGGGTRVDEAGMVEVESITLASILEPFDKVAFLKMDIEGGEYEVILGTPHAELAKIDRIAMEWHSSAMMDGKMPPLGAMLEWLAETHSLDCIGRASVGGMLFANSYSS